MSTPEEENHGNQKSPLCNVWLPLLHLIDLYLPPFVIVIAILFAIRHIHATIYDSMDFIHFNADHS